MLGKRLNCLLANAVLAEDSTRILLLAVGGLAYAMGARILGTRAPTFQNLGKRSDPQDHSQS
jgi:hypothetical protein